MDPKEQNEIEKITDEADEFLGDKEKFKDLIILLTTIADKIQTDQDFKNELAKLQEATAQNNSTLQKTVFDLVDAMQKSHQSIRRIAALIESRDLTTIINDGRKNSKESAEFLKGALKQFNDEIKSVRRDHDETVRIFMDAIGKLQVPVEDQPDTINFDWDRDSLVKTVEDYGGYKITYIYKRGTDGKLSQVIATRK